MDREGWNGTNFLILVENLIIVNLASTHLPHIHLGSYHFMICLTFSHLQAVKNKLLFNPMASPLLPTSHFTPALLTVCVKWGCRYFRVSMASLLRRESALSFPPWLRSLSPHANTVDKASFCCWGSLWWPIDGPRCGGGLSRWRPGCYHNMMTCSLTSCFYLPGKPKSLENQISKSLSWLSPWGFCLI